MILYAFLLSYIADGGDQYTGLDRFGRVIDQNWVEAGPANTDRFQYAYDADSDALYKNNLVIPGNSELYHQSSTISGDNDTAYDNLSRLTNFIRGTLTVSGNNGSGGTLGSLDTVTGGNLNADPDSTDNYSLDTLGNWSSQTVDGTETSRTHNSKNQVTVVGSADLTFDYNGNTLTDDKGTTYTYDAWNRMMTATPVGTNHEEYYTYDALNRRVTDLDGTISTTPVLVINDGSPQRSMIESLTMVFPQPVTLSSGAITLAGRTVGSITLSITNPSSDGKTYLITFSNSAQLVSGSLNNDIYDLTLTASDISGAGAPGSNQTYTFYDLYGDFYGTDTVDFGDYSDVVGDFGATAGESDYVWFMDYDGSGEIDFTDYLSVSTNFGDSYSFTPSGAILQGTSATEVLTYLPYTPATGYFPSAGKVLEGLAPRDLYYSRNWQVLEERGQNPNTAATETDMQYVWSAAYVDCLVLRDRDTDGNSATGNYGISGSGLDERLYAQQDANWNTTALVDTSGDVQEYFVYDPYGNVTVMDSSGDIFIDNYHWSYLHQGGRLDLATGLYDFRNRPYSVSLGRWATEEQFGAHYVDGKNLYTMERGNPANGMDPYGLMYVDEGPEPYQPPYVPVNPIGTRRWNSDGLPISDGPQYGNWGGKDWSGGWNTLKHGGQMGDAPPIDSSDSIYEAHDKCYDKANKDRSACVTRCQQAAQLLGSAATSLGSVDIGQFFHDCEAGCQQQHDMDISNCNKALVCELQELSNNPRNWPQPPPDSRMDDDAEAYRVQAINYFGTSGVWSGVVDIWNLPW